MWFNSYYSYNKLVQYVRVCVCSFVWCAQKINQYTEFDQFFLFSLLHLHAHFVIYLLFNYSLKHCFQNDLFIEMALKLFMHPLNVYQTYFRGLCYYSNKIMYIGISYYVRANMHTQYSNDRPLPAIIELY